MSLSLIKRALPLALLLLVSCRDSPKEVLESATEAAAKGDLVTVKEQFSLATVQRLERAWVLSQTPPADGWKDLAEKLVAPDGKPLGIGDEAIYGDLARVMATAGASERDYYFRKEDGHWRLELGAGLHFMRAEAKAKAEEAAKEAAKDPEKAKKQAKESQKDDAKEPASDPTSK